MKLPDEHKRQMVWTASSQDAMKELYPYQENLIVDLSKYLIKYNNEKRYHSRKCASAFSSVSG